MHLWSIVVALAAVVTEAADPSPIGATVNAEGVTEIFGNSFGRPGFNATYDYIVSELFNFLFFFVWHC